MDERTRALLAEYGTSYAICAMTAIPQIRDAAFFNVMRDTHGVLHTGISHTTIDDAAEAAVDPVVLGGWEYIVTICLSPNRPNTTAHLAPLGLKIKEAKGIGRKDNEAATYCIPKGSEGFSKGSAEGPSCRA